MSIHGLKVWSFPQDLTEMFAKNEGERELPSIDVQYFPMQACALTSTAFILPTGSAAALKSRYSVPEWHKHNIDMIVEQAHCHVLA